MKKHRYEVIFQTGEIEIVNAFNVFEAIILAQAKQIEKGNECKYIKNITSKHKNQ